MKDQGREEASPLPGLDRIVQERDKASLERYCLGRIYWDVMDYAGSIGIDPEELEELLAEI